MEAKPQLETEPIQYNHSGTRFLVALIVFMALTAQIPLKGSKMPSFNDYFFVLTFAALLASYLLVRMIDYFIKRLDRKYPPDMESQRWLYQLLLCIVLPTAICMLLLNFYYNAYDYDLIHSNRRIIHSFTPLFFYTILNLYYTSYWFSTTEKRKQEAEQQEEESKMADVAAVTYLPEELPLIITSEKEKRWARMPDGDLKDWEHTIEKSFLLLTKGEYIILSRDIICRKDNLIAAAYQNRKYTVKTSQNKHITLSEAVSRKNRPFLRSLPPL